MPSNYGYDISSSEEEGGQPPKVRTTLAPTYPKPSHDVARDWNTALTKREELSEVGQQNQNVLPDRRFSGDIASAGSFE